MVPSVNHCRILIFVNSISTKVFTHFDTKIDMEFNSAKIFKEIENQKYVNLLQSNFCYGSFLTINCIDTKF